MSVDVGSVPASSGSSNTSVSGSGNGEGKQGGAHQPQMGSPSPTQTQTQTQPSQSHGGSETYEVKVNGKTVKMSKDELIAHASKSHAADSRFEEAAKIRKQVEKIIHTAKSNPIEALMDPSLGLTKDQIRDAFEKWYTQEFIEPETLSPDQRRARELEAKLKKYEEQEQEAKERAEREQQETLTSQQREYLQGQIIEAMEKSGLPKTKFFAQRMAFYMRENLRQGWDAPIELIANQVKKERQEMLKDIVGSSDIQTLIDIFGEEGINKIRRHDLEQLRSRRNPQSLPQKSSPDGYGNNSEKISSSEVTRRLREMRMGKR